MKGCLSFPVLLAVGAALALAGCVSIAKLVKDGQASTAIDTTIAPLGPQATENFIETHQPRGFRAAYTVRF